MSEEGSNSTRPALRRVTMDPTSPESSSAYPPLSQTRPKPQRSNTMHSFRQSHTGDFVSRADADRETKLKLKWLEAKRQEQLREDEYRTEVEVRLHREELVRSHSEETLNEGSDPDLIVWEDDDLENPQNFTNKRKAWISGLCFFLTINVTFASSAPSPAVMAIGKEFGVSQEAAVLITTIFLCGYVAGPILWAPASELFGRRPVFVSTALCFTLFQLGQSLGHNFATVIVTRFFAGLFGSAPLSNCGGVVADIWGPVGRGHAMALFAGSVFLGPVLGPVVGGFIIDSFLGWRWIFWVMMIYAGFCCASVALFLPETYGPILLVKRARRLRKQDSNKHGNKYAKAEHEDFSPRALLDRTIFRPFIMLAQEPILVLITIYMSIIYGLLYALFSVFPIIWQQMRGFNERQGGLIFIGIGIGTSIGTAYSIYLQRHYGRLVSKWHGSPPPEVRLPGAMVAGPCLVIGIFWLGWTGAFPSVPWYVPALATIPIGMSFSLIFISYFMYMVDTYLLFSASALAVNSVFRSIMGAVFPLFTRQMFDGLRVQWALTLIGCVSILMLPVPFLFHKFGQTIRQRSKFAPCLDIKIKKQVEQEERELKTTEKKAKLEHLGSGDV